MHKEEYLDVMSSDELKDGRGISIRVGNKRVAVFREKGDLYCVDDMCPHAGASLGTGTVLKGVIYCPWHQWGFEGSNGRCVTGSIWHVDTYPIREEGGRIWVNPTPVPHDPGDE